MSRFRIWVVGTAFALATAVGAGNALADPEEMVTWVAVSHSELSELRGGSDQPVEFEFISQVESNQNASSFENVIGDGVLSGPINISDSAISEFTGVLQATMNTGHNALLQSNMIVTIHLE